MRGFLLGTVSGLAFAAVVLGTASLVARQPAGNTPPERPQTDLPDAVPQTLPTPETAEPGTAGPVASDSPALGPAPMVAPPAAAPALPVTDTAPADQPEPAVPEARLLAPEIATAPAVAPEADAPVAPARPMPAPQIPPAEAGVDLSTAPPPPPTAAPEATPGPDLPAVPDAAPVSAGAPAMRTPEAESPAVPPPTLAAEAAGDAAPPAEVDPAPVTAEAAAPAVTAPQGDAPVAVPAPAADAAPPAAVPEAAATPRADSAPPAASPPAAPPETAAVTDTVPPGLPGGDAGVRVNRPAADPAPAADAAPEPAAADAADADLPALERHAAAFDNPEGLPLLSLVLIDDGRVPAGPQVAAAIGIAITVAIDPGRADAAEAMAAWRAAGHEVVALSRLPEGATPVDADVVLRATFETLPETVALLDLGVGGLQGDRDLTERALRILAETGRGFVSATEGLDPALRLADAAGVPAVEVLRDLDGAGQDGATIRRFLDNAAFRARQDGRAVVIARLQPDTVTALQLWTSANRAAQVAFAPLSAVLAPTAP